MATVNEKIRECCEKCKNRNKSNLVCYGGKFCGKCPSLIQGKSEPPKEYT